MKWILGVSVFLLAGCAQSDGISEHVMWQGDVAGYEYLPADTEWVAALSGGMPNPSWVDSPFGEGSSKGYYAALGWNGSEDIAILSVAAPSSQETIDEARSEGCTDDFRLMLSGDIITMIQGFEAETVHLDQVEQAIRDRTGADSLCDHPWF